MPARLMTIQDLKNELARRTKSLGTIQSERKKLLARLAAVDKEIAAIDGGGKTRRRAKKKAKRVTKVKKVKKVGKAKRTKTVVKARRPGRPKAVRKAGKAKAGRRRRRATGKPLTAYLQEALAGAKGGMRTIELVDAVTKAGYKTHSKDFYAIVAIGLRDTKTFKRLSRGVYGLVK